MLRFSKPLREQCARSKLLFLRDRNAESGKKTKGTLNTSAKFKKRCGGGCWRPQRLDHPAEEPETQDWRGHFFSRASTRFARRSYGSSFLSMLDLAFGRGGRSSPQPRLEARSRSNFEELILDSTNEKSVHNIVNCSQPDEICLFVYCKP